MGKITGDDVENGRLVLELLSERSVRNFARNVLDALTEDRKINLKSYLKEIEIARQYEELMKIKKGQEGKEV